jgi:hypothetical protein
MNGVVKVYVFLRSWSTILGMPPTPPPPSSQGGQSSYCSGQLCPSFGRPCNCQMGANGGNAIVVTSRRKEELVIKKSEPLFEVEYKD